MGPDDSDNFRAVAGLAEALGSTVELLTQQRTQALSAQAIVDLAQQYMPRAQDSGLLLHTGGRMRTIAASSDLPQRLDRLRDRVGEGPAVDALETNDYVVSDDLADDPRWPRLVPAAVDELRIRSVAFYRLNLGCKQRGVLMCFSDLPSAFDEMAVAIGAMFAAYCSLVLVTEQLVNGRAGSPKCADELRGGLGVAAGILLASRNVPVGEAYRLLYQASCSLSCSLPEVAQHVITHRELPGGA